jgi:hypothetical protein
VPAPAARLISLAGLFRPIVKTHYDFRVMTGNARRGLIAARSGKFDGDQ